MEPGRAQLHGLWVRRHPGRSLRLQTPIQHWHRARRHRWRRRYTYLNPTTGIEFSGVAGFTYNFKNPTTQYQSGIDFHFDWGASHFLSKQLFVGMVGYAYQQVTDDIGAAPFLNGFKSRVFGFGPQLGYLLPIGDKQGYLNFKGYREFASENRPEGW